MKKSLLIISAVFIISGCASSESKIKRIDITEINLDNAFTENGEKLYCKRESVTGSHLKTTTCLTKAQKDAARRNTEDYVGRLKRSPDFKSTEPNG